MTESIRNVGKPSASGGGHHKIKPWMLYAGGGAVVLGVYFFVIRPRSQAAATGDPTIDTSGVDSSLGYADTSGNTYGSGSLGGYYDPSTGTFIPTGGDTTITAPSTNAAWVQQASAYLAQSGYNRVAVLSALGRYVTSTRSIAVSEHELHIIQSAIGAEGYPPVRPPDPHLQPSGGQTKKTHQVKTQSAGTLHEIADRQHMQLREFIKLNPVLAARYANTAKKIPAGTTITVYV